MYVMILEIERHFVPHIIICQCKSSVLTAGGLNVMYMSLMIKEFQ